MPASPTHAELSDALRKHRLAVDASDLHGSLTGYLCAGGRADPDTWLDALQLDCDDASVAQDEVLQRLYAACRASCSGGTPEVQPLLPAPGTPLPQRADALVHWCRGFLGGFGLGGASEAGLSAQGNDVLADFARIAAARIDHADAAADEAALVDLRGFASAGAALLHREAQAAASRRSLH